MPFVAKRTVVPNRIPNPSDLMDGELAVNVFDGVLYMKQRRDDVEYIIPVDQHSREAIDQLTSRVALLESMIMSLLSSTSNNNVSSSADSSTSDSSSGSVV